MIAKYLKYLLAGLFFGFILTKAEVISWFRIQEMFRFDSFHMYGVIGSAVLTGIISIQILKGSKLKSSEGTSFIYPVKKFNKGMLIGGIIFGLGWALTGACPGPIFALIGNGYPVFILTLLSALFGVWVYGRLQDKLPH